jgi:hypothetical protein
MLRMCVCCIFTLSKIIRSILRRHTPHKDGYVTAIAQLSVCGQQIAHLLPMCS